MHSARIIQILSDTDHVENGSVLAYHQDREAWTSR
jgi:hypothetical protein